MTFDHIFRFIVASLFGIFFGILLMESLGNVLYSFKARLYREEERKMIKHVYLWRNGLTMVFDEKGEQMPDYQGPLGEKFEMIKAEYTGTWIIGDYKKVVIEVPSSFVTSDVADIFRRYDEILESFKVGTYLLPKEKKEDA